MYTSKSVGGQPSGYYIIYTEVGRTAQTHEEGQGGEGVDKFITETYMFQPVKGLRQGEIIM